MRHRGVLVTLACAAGAACFAAACTSSSAPAPPFTTLVGSWATQDTFAYTYAWTIDGTPSQRRLVNQITTTVSALTDTSYTVTWLAGSQQEFDSLAGQPASRQTIPVTAGSSVTAVVRSDTVFLTGFGSMPLDRATATTIVSQRWLSPSACLVAVGPIGRAAPAPTCYEAHHWTRTP